MKSEQTKHTAPKLTDRPKVEKAWQGVPLTFEIDPDSPKDAPMLFDRENYGKSYCVEDGEIYTIRLGIHSDSNGVGVISGDSSAICVIPTESGKCLHIMAIFSIDELHPAVFLDCAYLTADTTFHLEYVYRSAMLESNNGLNSLTLSDEATQLKDDLVVVSHHGLAGEIPDYCTYLYDFITVQVRVVFDETLSERTDRSKD